MTLYKLNKTVLYFKNNAEQFLNGLTSNDMDKPVNAALNIHGRIVATFDQLKLSEEDVLVVVETTFLEPLLAHFDRYVLLAGIKIKKEKYDVFFDLESNYQIDHKEYCIFHKKGRIILASHTPQGPFVSDEEFRLFRLKNNIPWFGVDYDPEEMLLNVSEDFVSYTKGCYLGQEFISKVHSRSKPTWKLIVKYEDECSGEEKQKMTSKAIDPTTQRTLGFVFVKN